MKVKINLFAKIFENYNVDENGFGEVPYWKPKGSHTFIIENVDSDELFYVDRAALIETFQELLNQQSNEAERFEYYGHDVLFTESSLISGDKFQEALNKSLNQ
jgi:hypothetical protein